MAKMIKFNPNGKATFKTTPVNGNGQEYEVTIPQELLDFINLNIFPEYYLWHHTETLSGEEEYQIEMNSNSFVMDGEVARFNWKPNTVDRLSFRWSNNKIIRLTITAYYIYEIKKPPTLSKLIYLLRNEKDMLEFIIKYAKLKRSDKKLLKKYKKF